MIVYVDVDETLVSNAGAEQQPIFEVVAHLRRIHAEGVKLYCWSAGGADYARRCAALADVEDLFETFLPKPRAMIDDTYVADWPFCVAVHPRWCTGKSWNDYLDPGLETGLLNE